MNNVLRVACSGTGYFSKFHYEAWSRLDNVELIGVCNRDIEKAKSFAETYKIEHYYQNLELMLLELKPDFLDIITPPVTHLDAVTIAAKLGIDVCCQKPFGENLEQAQQMVKMAKNAGIKLVIHENFRFMPWIRKAKEELDSGVLGEVLNVQFNLRPGDGQGNDAYLARQAYFQDMPKFLIHETGIHIVDVFRYFFGEPYSVYAQLRRCNPVIKGEDAGTVIFQFAENLQAILDGNRLLDHNSSNTRRTMGECQVEGTQGTLNIDGEGRMWLRKIGEQINNEIHYDWQDKNFGGDCVYQTIKHIVQHYHQDTPLENQGFEYLHNILVEQAIYRSNEQRMCIDLDLQPSTEVTP
ncbi:Gfo/Idh/MocA family oxidoreductase [Colwellia sp. PAMC 21821]|uniref:Gfo/Idh/MocA family protein n=1 Tax=Colwellia sp. PAMC 21821 TaxID=1816219 RepID=UPI0009BF6985|nr:Gfo/Idh/MocA family oxidoreductase [Colwellia sp. PAMC 21821]